MQQSIHTLGRISEPAFSTSQAGNPILKFGLAVQTTKGGETTWFNMLISGKFASAMQPILKKGQLVSVYSRMSVSKGTDGKLYHTFFVDDLKICSDGNVSGEAVDNTTQPQNGAVSDDDIPF